jgi:hypothetical protein
LRQRKKRIGSYGRFGARPRKRVQSTVAGEASFGTVYCHAPIAELRLNQASTMFSSPIAPEASSSLALWCEIVLGRWLPTWNTLPDFLWASMILWPSSQNCTIGFSQ